MADKQLTLFEDLRRVPKNLMKYTRRLKCARCFGVPISTIKPAPLCQDCAPAIGEEEQMVMGSCGLRRA
jgi:hypothetical protein